MAKFTKYTISSILIFMILVFAMPSTVFSDEDVKKPIPNCHPRQDNSATALSMSQEVPPPPKTITLDGIKIIAERHRLKAYTTSEEADDEVSVKQLDYGEIKGIALDRNQAIIAFGPQTSYRVKITKISGKAHFYDKEKLPELYLYECGIMDVIAGACQITTPSFSPELKAAFVSGFDKIGLERSYAFGLRNTLQKLHVPKKEVPSYVSDVPGSGNALFKTKTEIFYLFDGQYFQECFWDKPPN